LIFVIIPENLTAFRTTRTKTIFIYSRLADEAFF
jgi:hypothetical protein